MDRTIVICLLASFLFVIGCEAARQAARMNNMTDEEVEAYNADPNNTDKIVCKKEKPIGSNIPRRVCHKESYLEDRTRQDQRAIDEIQRNTLQPGPP